MNQKHKAQHALNSLKEFDDNYSSTILQLAENIDLYDDIEPSYKNEEDINLIQELISCQLTIPELEFIMNLLYSVKQNDSIIKDILYKLWKQKELWDN